MLEDRKVYVYISLEKQDIFVGTLWSHFRHGDETASFEYDKDWLANPNAFSLEPSLELFPGQYHTKHKLFGAIGDSAPDRWGRTLMRNNEIDMAKAEKRSPRTLNEIDYLLLVNDQTRQGALRFKSDISGTFLSSSPTETVPPLVKLPELLSAAEKTSENKATPAEIKLLLQPGSSLGGARPKASVIDTDGTLCIAKFPKKDDNNNVVLWEGVALDLAKRAGIKTPEWKIITVANKKVIILKRFDRQGEKRIPFLSAMSMLGAEDGDDNKYSCLDIADALIEHGASTNEDLEELWRRIVFSIAISNTDDHLRNHGFLYTGQQGWRLSPVYDVNPNPDSQGFLHTYISKTDNTADYDIALSVCENFRVKLKDAKEIINHIKGIVSDFAVTAKRFNVSASEIERMSHLFKI